jgi:Glycosyltransferase
MHVGIISNCDINAFSYYLDEESRSRIVYRDSIAPAVNTLLLALLKAGVRVSIFTLHPGVENMYLKGEQLSVYVSGGYDAYPGKYLYGTWINANRLRDSIAQNIEGIDILHAHWTYEYAWAAGHFTRRLPVVCTVRDWAPLIWRMVSAKDKITWIAKYFMDMAVFKNPKISFIANSPYTQDKIRKRWSKNCPMIPNSIKESFLRTERVYYPKKLTVVSISQSNDKRKNIKSLLLAFQQVHAKYPESQLLLVGQPFQERDEVIQKWRREGLLTGVQLLGAVNHDSLMDVLDEVSVMVHPSREETFGNILLEAMARRVPIIAGKDAGAVPYVLEHGQSGCLCDVTSPKDIADKLEYVYLNEAYRNQLVNSATSTLINNYLESDIGKKHIDLYEETIAQYTEKRTVTN